jgi:hypothetical protein
MPHTMAKTATPPTAIPAPAAADRPVALGSGGGDSPAPEVFAGELDSAELAVELVEIVDEAEEAEEAAEVGEVDVVGVEDEEVEELVTFATHHVTESVDVP